MGAAIQQIPSIDGTLNRMEEAMLAMPPAEFPSVDRFTTGLYIRETLLPAGSVLTSMIHKTEHPFVILRGKVKVVSENEGPVVYEGPCIGITKPGTRRALHAITDTVWITFHPTTETDVEKIAEMILERPNNPAIPEGHPSADRWKESLTSALP